MRPRGPAHALAYAFGAAVLGALHSVVFVQLAAWPVQMVIVGVVATVGSRLTPWASARFGWIFATSWLACGIWWLFISMHRYGGLPAWLSVLAIVLLCGFLSLYMALALGLFARLRGHSAWRGAVLFAALWLLAEVARGALFTGFPWLASGYAHVQSPWAVLAPWVGVYGIGCVAAFVAAWVALGWARGGRERAVALVAAALALGACTAWGPAQYTRPVGTLTVSLLQSQVSQDEKFDPERIPQALDWARSQLLAAPGDLVVAPETVIPLLPADLDPQYWASIVAHFHDGTQGAVLGLPLGNEEVGYTNSAVGISAATRTDPQGYYRYDKHHLVPFGEFIPDGFKWFTRLMNIPLGDFNRGPVGAPSFAFRDERIGVNICYEDLFGEELAERFDDGARAPTLFANISNIGWFGDTIAVEQHLQISRMRALEFQRPMLRATNTGPTVVIDAQGHVDAALAHAARGVLNGTVQGRSGLTPYARWACAFGLWPLVLAALVMVLLSAAPQPARRR